MRRENGYVIFENLVLSEGQASDEALNSIKYEPAHFNTPNASADTRKVESLEEVAEIARDMGGNFTKAFAIT